MNAVICFNKMYSMHGVNEILRNALAKLRHSGIFLAGIHFFNLLVVDLLDSGLRRNDVFRVLQEAHEKPG